MKNSKEIDLFLTLAFLDKIKKLWFWGGGRWSSSRTRSIPISSKSKICSCRTRKWCISDSIKFLFKSRIINIQSWTYAIYTITRKDISDITRNLLILPKRGSPRSRLRPMKNRPICTIKEINIYSHISVCFGQSHKQKKNDNRKYRS